jgi:hypothetical protein
MWHVGVLGASSRLWSETRDPSSTGLGTYTDREGLALCFQDLRWIGPEFHLILFWTLAPSSGIRYRVAWHKVTDVSEKPDASIFRTQENSTIKVEAVGSSETVNFPPNDGVTSDRTLIFILSPPEPQISHSFIVIAKRVRFSICVCLYFVPTLENLECLPSWYIRYIGNGQKEDSNNI